MKNFLLGIAACSLALTTFAQEQPFVCGTDELHQHLIETDPGYLERRAEYEAEIQQLIRENAHLRDDHVVVTIPVVFHVLHLGGRENISDEQIHDALAILNRDFRGLDPATNTAIQHFQNIAADARIEFALPTLDPLGHCTNGINRINTVETLRGRAESKLQPWPRARYLNIWVTRIIDSGAAGYATKPGSVEGLGQIRDGIMVLHDYVGSIGTSNESRSRTLTHEVGHYFNLDHPWGATNVPTLECGDDGVQDTPFTKGHNTCQGNSPPPGPPVNIRYDYTCSMTPIEDSFDFASVAPQGGNVDPTPSPVASAAQLHVEPIMGFSSFLISSGNVDITPLPVLYLQGIAGEAMTFEPFTAVGLSANTHNNFEFAFSQWSIAFTPEKYYEFSYHPQPGFGFDASELRFAVRRTPNGPRKFAVSIGPNFNTFLPLSSVSPNVQVEGGDVGVINNTFPGWVSNVTVDLEGATQPNEPVTIRFYAWDGDDEGGIFALNNVEVIGNIYHESLDFSPFTAVGVSSGSVVQGEFAFTNWDLGAEDGLTDPALLVQEPSGAQYYEVTITPKIEIAMNPTNVTFYVRRSADGPRTFAVRKIPTGPNLPISAGANNPNIQILSGNRGFFINDEAGDWVSITANLGAPSDPQAPLTLRIYAWNAETEDGYFSIDNVSFTGTFGIIENVENYMEYAFCQKMFTIGQSDRMRAALNSPVGQRSSMWTDNTLQVTGVAEGYQANCAPIADFYVVPGGGTGGFNDPVIPFPSMTCGSTQVMFKDNSGGGAATEWYWTFQDGDPATSTERNPIVTFAVPGWKEVTLTVSNAVGADTKSKPWVIYIGTPEVAMAGLGSYSFEEPLGTWPFIYVNYEGNHTKWQRYVGAGHTGNACIYLNAGERDPVDYVDPDNAGDYDDLISPLLNLTGVQDATLSFWYSYSTQTNNLADVQERLQIQRSTDCGRTWTWITGSESSSTIRVSVNPFNTDLLTNGNSDTPGSWVFRSFNIPAAALTENVRFRWRFISSEFSNHLFIDDINIGGPVGIHDLDPNSLMTVYPNPANDHFYVNMTGMDVHPTEIMVMDGRGAIVFTKTYAPQGGSGIMISSQDLGIADGLYVIRASNNEGTSTQKLMVGR